MTDASANQVSPVVLAIGAVVVLIVLVLAFGDGSSTSPRPAAPAKERADRKEKVERKAPAIAPAKAARFVKGTPEAKAHMAAIRAKSKAAK